MGKSSDQSYVIISYFPMCSKFTPKHKTIADSPTLSQLSAILKIVTDSAVSVAGCLWLVDENSEYAPVFMVPNAEALYRDLCQWCEDKPSKWFTLDWGVSVDRYALIIMPNLQESTSRFKRRCVMEREEFIEDRRTMMLFQPLSFGSCQTLKLTKKEFAQLPEAEQKKIIEANTAETTAMLSERLPPNSKRRIGLLDPDRIDVAKLTIDAEPFWIGPLNVVPNSDYAMKHLQEQLKT